MRDERGLSAIEHVLLIATIALVALGGWTALGAGVDASARCAAQAIATGTSGPCGASTASAGATSAALTSTGTGTGTGTGTALTSRGTGTGTGTSTSTSTSTSTGTSMLGAVDTLEEARAVEERYAGVLDTAAEGGDPDGDVSIDDWRAAAEMPGQPRELYEAARFMIRRDEPDGCSSGFLRCLGRGVVHAAVDTKDSVVAAGEGLIHFERRLFAGDGKAWTSVARATWFVTRYVAGDPDATDQVNRAATQMVKVTAASAAQSVAACTTRFDASRCGDAMGRVTFDAALVVLTDGAGGAVRGTRQGLALRARTAADRREPIVYLGRRSDDAAPISGELAGAELNARVRYAFGDRDNPIQLSAEMEQLTAQSDEAILEYYRPSTISEARWKTMGPSSRMSWVRQNGGYEGLVRMRSAPDTFGRTLAAEGDRNMTWEVVTDGHVETLDDLRRHAERVQKIGAGGFHWHVSFRPDPRRAREITAFLAHANEFSALRSFAGSQRAVFNKNLGPYTTDRLDAIERALRRGEPADDKYADWSIRSLAGSRRPLFDDPHRISIEIRDGGYTFEGARARLEATIDFLERPAETRLRFGDAPEGRSYLVSEIAGVERASMETFARFTDKQRAFLEVAAAKGETKPLLRVGGERVEGEAALRYGADQLMQRWSFPLVRWEDRPHIPASAHAAIRAERARFLEELDELIARFESRGVGMENGSFAVSCLVKDWAERVSLYRYY